jgi:ATP-dependent Clp protease ATP-binding subunit ClpA
LTEAVFDQENAIEQLTSAIYLARAGLREVNKPQGSYLLIGTTGSGKCLGYSQNITVKMPQELAHIIDSL